MVESRHQTPATDRMRQALGMETYSFAQLAPLLVPARFPGPLVELVSSFLISAAPARSAIAPIDVNEQLFMAIVDRALVEALRSLLDRGASARGYETSALRNYWALYQTNHFWNSLDTNLVRGSRLAMELYQTRHSMIHAAMLAGVPGYVTLLRQHGAGAGDNSRAWDHHDERAVSTEEILAALPGGARREEMRRAVYDPLPAPAPTPTASVSSTAITAALGLLLGAAACGVGVAH